MVVVHAVGPFSTDDTQLPGELVRRLHERGLPDVATDALPTSPERAFEDISQLIAERRPSAWIGIGFAGARMALSLEGMAVNLRSWAADDAEPDTVELGTQARMADGPEAYMTTVPVDEVLAAWSASGVPGYLSLSASSRTGNFAFYAAAHAVAELGLDCRVGFLNVPRTPQLLTEPKAQPSVSMDLQVQGLVDLVTAVSTSTSAAGPYLSSTL